VQQRRVALDVQHERRGGDLPQQRRIFGMIIREQQVARLGAPGLHRFHLLIEIDRRRRQQGAGPGGLDDGAQRVVPGLENRFRRAEAFEQRMGRHQAHAAGLLQAQPGRQRGRRGE